MGSEGASEFIVDQGLYYPATANYYGFYSAGTESPGESDNGEHHRFLCSNGQDIQYSGLQTENSPYVYVTPTYSYTQSPYNPYNPYIPGAVLGIDGQFVGADQYFTNPLHDPAVSYPAYSPAIVQSTPNGMMNGSLDPGFMNNGAPTITLRPDYAGMKYVPLASTNAAVTSERIALGNPVLKPPNSGSLQIQTSSGSLVQAPQIMQSSSHNLIAGAVPRATQATYHLKNEELSSFYRPSRVTTPFDNGFTNSESSFKDWASADKFQPRLLSNEILMTQKGRPNISLDQNGGPRSGRSKDTISAISVRDYTTQCKIIISADQYNKYDFQTDYPTAKFFVIKSYTEDDVHKSIKYNVWSSTQHGNKKLDNAYEDAQRMSIGKPRHCPVFLFFSVNTSGHFCGVAEMVGRVDFHKNMDFWQQDKWLGCFPVKWHIIKDVPNSSLRSIILENNDFIPVTSSRDTQEITYIPGMGMLRIFKQSPLHSSLLDHFGFYERREKILRELKCGNGTSRGSPLLLSVFIPSTGLRGMVSQQADVKQLNGSVDLPVTSLEKPGVSIEETQKDDGRKLENAVDCSLKTGGECFSAGIDQCLESDGSFSTAEDNQNPVDLIQHSGVPSQLPEADLTKPSGVATQDPEVDEKRPNATVNKLFKGNGRQLNHAINKPSKMNKKQSHATADVSFRVDVKQTKHAVIQISEAEGKQPNATAYQSIKAKETNDSAVHTFKRGQNTTRPGACNLYGNVHYEQVIPKSSSSDPSDAKIGTKSNTEIIHGLDAVTENAAAVESKADEDKTNDVFLVGSVQVKVKNHSGFFHGKSSADSVDD